MMPPWKFPRSSFSFGACAFSSGSPTPKSTDGRPRISWKVATTGIDPPSRLNTGVLPNPFPVEHRRLADPLLDRPPRRLHEPVVELGHPRFAAVHARDLHVDGLRGDL